MRTPKHPCDFRQLWACSLRSCCAEATGQSKKSPAGPGFKSWPCPGDLTVMLTHEAAVEMQPGEAGARQATARVGSFSPFPRSPSGRDTTVHQKDLSPRKGGMDYLQCQVIPLLRRIQRIPGDQCPGDAGGVRAQGPQRCLQVKASAWHTGSARAQCRAWSRLK